jgi:hypothetical protein
MKNFFLILIIVSISFNIAFSQNASTYFPSNQGYKWYYKNTPLDSINNPMPNLARFRVDSFAVVQIYNGLQASIVRVKDNLLTINQNTPYTDTNFHNFQGTNGWEYMNFSLIPDTMGIPIGILNFFKGMQGWYNVFQFASSVGTQYSILTKDTTISYNSLPVHLRVKVNAKRLGDEQVSTVNGTYTAKKFAVTYGMYIVVLTFEQPIVVRADTTWIASGVWMIRETSPSIALDLSAFGYGTMQVPGQIYELTLPIGIHNISSTVPDKFELFQNYPNPFNPSSIIRFKIKDSRFVILKVFNALGREVVTLVNEKLNAGEYQATFDGSELASGIYFYKLMAGDFVQTRKMILIK